MHENSEKMFILSEKRRKTKKSPRIIPFLRVPAGWQGDIICVSVVISEKNFNTPPMFSSNESVSEKF